MSTISTILKLGGTGDALRIASVVEKLISTGPRKSPSGQTAFTLIYSIAGVARVPVLDCEINVGGFGGWRGLHEFIKSRSVVLVVDATHPYASLIKCQAQRATAAADITYYRYNRPAWSQQTEDNWEIVQSLDMILESITNYQRPFFSIGKSALQLLLSKQHLAYTDQHWTIRHIHTANLSTPESRNDLSLINAVGPFSIDAELQLFAKQQTDVLITKNSGGTAVSAKIVAARQLGIPVVMLQRPTIDTVKWQFDNISAVESAIQTFIRYQSSALQV